MSSISIKDLHSFTGRNYVAISSAIGMLFAAHGAWYMSGYGCGITFDSAFYINSAFNLLGGNGYTIDLFDGVLRPFAWFPPGYPAVIAIFLFLVDDIRVVTVGINCLCMMFSFVIVSLILRRHSRGSEFYAVVCAMLYGVSIISLEIHSWAQSEPLFTLFTLASLYSFEEYLETNGTKAIVLSAVLCFASVMTRYAGVSLVIALLSGIALLANRSAYVKLKAAALFLVIVCVPLLIWMVRNKLSSGAFTNRPMTSYSIGSEKLGQLVYSFASVVVPGSDRVRLFIGQEYVAAALGALIVVLAVIWFVQSMRGRDRHCAASRIDSCAIYAIYPFVYIVVLAMLMSFVDSTLVFDIRLMSISFVSVFLFCACVLLKHAYRTRISRMLVDAVAITAILVNVTSYIVWTNYMRDNGRGQSSRSNSSSYVTSFILSNANSCTFYTNNVEGLYFSTGISMQRYDKICTDYAIKKEFKEGYIIHLSSNDNLTLNQIKWSRNELPDCVNIDQVSKDNNYIVYRIVNAGL